MCEEKKGNSIHLAGIYRADCCACGVSVVQVRHRVAGGGLDSGIMRFDVSADGTKIIGKAGPEEFDWDIESDNYKHGIDNPYVYILNLLTGQVTKAD